MALGCLYTTAQEITDPIATTPPPFPEAEPHPRPPLRLSPSFTGPVPTNTFGLNLLVAEGDMPLYAQPYTLRAIATGPRGVIISQTDRRVFGPPVAGDATRTRYYLAPFTAALGVSAAEALSSTRPAAERFAVERMDTFSTQLHFPLGGDAGLRFPVVRGMAYVTAEYSRATPALYSEAVLLTANGAPVSPAGGPVPLPWRPLGGAGAQGAELELHFNSDQVWLLFLYAPPGSSPPAALEHKRDWGADAAARAKGDESPVGRGYPSALLGAAPFTGIVRVARLEQRRGAEPAAVVEARRVLLRRHAHVVPTGAEVTVSVAAAEAQGDETDAGAVAAEAATVAVHWRVTDMSAGAGTDAGNTTASTAVDGGGAGPALLHFALPHQLDALGLRAADRLPRGSDEAVPPLVVERPAAAVRDRAEARAKDTAARVAAIAGGRGGGGAAGAAAAGGETDVYRRMRAVIDSSEDDDDDATAERDGTRGRAAMRRETAAALERARQWHASCRRRAGGCPAEPARPSVLASFAPETPAHPARGTQPELEPESVVAAAAGSGLVSPLARARARAEERRAARRARTAAVVAAGAAPTPTRLWQRSTTKGPMRALVGTVWPLREPLPVERATALLPAAAPRAETVPALLDALDLDLGATGAAQARRLVAAVRNDGVYTSGKELWRHAQLCLVQRAMLPHYGAQSTLAQELARLRAAGNTTGAAVAGDAAAAGGTPLSRADAEARLRRCVAALGLALSHFPRGANGNPLLWERTWGGVAGALGLAQGADPNVDFGSSYYNDHHFHYGYVAAAAAAMAALSPGWADRPSGGLAGSNRAWVDALVRDVANPALGANSTADPHFPRLRNMDLFAGHSWSQGVFPSFDGKDLESTSEEVHFHYGVALWGAATDRPALRQLGRTLLAVAARGFRRYFYLQPPPAGDARAALGAVHPTEFSRNYAPGITFEGKVDYATWFGINAEYIHGIQMLPVSPALAFVRPAAHARAEWSAVVGRVAKDLKTAWAAVLWLHYSLVDPRTAYETLAGLLAAGKPIDNGMSRTWALFWAACAPEPVIAPAPGAAADAHLAESRGSRFPDVLAAGAGPQGRAGLRAELTAGAGAGPRTGLGGEEAKEDKTKPRKPPLDVEKELDETLPVDVTGDGRARTGARPAGPRVPAPADKPVDKPTDKAAAVTKPDEKAARATDTDTGAGTGPEDEEAEETEADTGNATRPGAGTGAGGSASGGAGAGGGTGSEASGGKALIPPHDRGHGTDRPAWALVWALTGLSGALLAATGVLALLLRAARARAADAEAKVEKLALGGLQPGPSPRHAHGHLAPGGSGDPGSASGSGSAGAGSGAGLAYSHSSAVTRPPLPPQGRPPASDAGVELARAEGGAPGEPVELPPGHVRLPPTPGPAPGPGLGSPSPSPGDANRAFLWSPRVTQRHK